MIVANNITGLMTMRLTLGELLITDEVTKLLSCCVVLLTLVNKDAYHDLAFCLVPSYHQQTNQLLT
jgi:hypothetical protein